MDRLVIRQNTRLDPGVHRLPGGIEIVGDGITLDGEGATLVGSNREGAGVRVQGKKGVVIENLAIRDYRHGIRAEHCRDLVLRGNRITSTAEVAPNTLFLDIWLPVDQAYGGAILLVDCAECDIEENDLQHQQNGILSYGCSALAVRRNDCGYNSGWGIHLFGTCDSLFQENHCDFCCRFEPRDGPVHQGHMGADAAGFLAVMGSCRNRFLRNTARLGGDGFFLAGLSPNGTHAGCDDNLFEENDASLSPNIAFEATFSQGNIFRNNFADRCNYGFWLGFSRDTQVTGNRMLFNRQAGIGTENGVRIVVRENHFQANGHGVLLWSKHVEAFAKSVPENDTSRDWTIEKNTFLHNGKGIRIAADQDHGIRDLPAEQRGKAPFPSAHRIIGNDIQENRLGVELLRAMRTVIEQNRLRGNVEANLREADCEETTVRANIGEAGAYL